MNMEIDNYYGDEDEVVRRGDSIEATPAGGIYSLPVLGHLAAGARQFYDEMAPRETDSSEVRIAKEVFRWGSAITGAAAVAVVVL
jgi:hypothetical protein